MLFCFTAIMNISDMLQAATHPILVADAKDQILDLNPAAEDLLGATREDLLGRGFNNVTEFRDVFGNRLCATGCSLHEMIRRGEPIQAFDLDIRKISGAYVRIGISVIVLLSPEGDSYRIIYHLIPRQQRWQRSWSSGETHDGRPNGSTAAPVNGHDPEAPQLTRRERQILSRLVAGERSREISDSLGIRPNTLRSHTQNILRKLKARSKVEAVSMVLRQNLL